MDMWKIQSFLKSLVIFLPIPQFLPFKIWKLSHLRLWHITMTKTTTTIMFLRSTMQQQRLENTRRTETRLMQIFLSVLFKNICCQNYHNKVSNVSTLLGGDQCIITPTRLIFTLVIESGLCCLPKRLPTLKWLHSIPKCLMCLDKELIPTLYNTKFAMDEYILSLPALP